MNKKEVHEALVKIIEDWGTLYADTVKSSYAKAISKLAPGSVVPKNNGKIVGREDLDDFLHKTVEVRNEALAIIGKYKDELISKQTDAPSDEAIRSLQIVSLRDPSQMLGAKRTQFIDELNRLAERYGDNYSVYQALSEMAHKVSTGLTIKNTIAEEIKNCDEALTYFKSAFSLLGIEQTGVTSGYLKILLMYTDSFFGEE